MSSWRIEERERHRRFEDWKRRERRERALRIAAVVGAFLLALGAGLGVLYAVVRVVRAAWG